MAGRYYRVASLFVAMLMVVSTMTGCKSGTVNVGDTADTGIQETEIDSLTENFGLNRITEASDTEETEEAVVSDANSNGDNIVAVEEQQAEQNDENDRVEDVDVENEDTTISSEIDALTLGQKNAINMLNYMTVMTQEINDSKESRLYLDNAYSSLINNIYPNAVDSKTQTQITSMLDTLSNYIMITEKRERLEYLYEQNQAQALRQAIPNPVGLLSAVKSGSTLKAAASVIYMAVDSVASYESASTQTELQYLQDGWELDDEEAQAVYSSRSTAFNYMIRMVKDNSLPGDYALNEDSVERFVEWKNKTNLASKIEWFESNAETYKLFGSYWLELAKDYYESGDYEKCLDAFDNYETVNSRIFRKDTDYAEALPMAVIAARETMSNDDYTDFADDYTEVILNNIGEEDWDVRYFVAQIYLDLYAITNNDGYLEKAYKIALYNVNILKDEQRELNDTYLADVQEIEADKDATKQEKKDTKQYNKMLKAERKTALPPVSEALYLNCDLLFALIDQNGIPEEEQNKIDAILHEDGDPLFLTEALDNRFRFEENEIDVKTIDVEFTGETLVIPVSQLTERSTISVVVTKSDGSVTTIDDWVVKKVKRSDSESVSDYIATYTSDTAKMYKYSEGDAICVIITPVVESKDKTLQFTYKAVSKKKLVLLNSISFDREY